MKNLKVLFTVLCVACTTAVWGETVSQTYTLSNSDNGQDKATGDVTWAIGTGAITAQSNNMKLTGTITVKLPAGATLTSVEITKSNTWGSGATVVFASGTTTLNTFSNSGTFTLTKNKTDLVYTFTKSGTNNKNAWVKTIKVTYESGSTETTVSFSPSSINFGTVTVGETKTQDVSVTIGNPTSSVNFSVTGSGLSVSPSSLSQNGTVTVTYKPTTAGTLNGTLTASGGGLKTDVTATITGTAQASATTYYTVTWMVGGQKYTEGNPTTSVTGGSKVTTLPDAPADNSLSCAEKFMGWSAQHIGTNPQDDAPADLFTTADASPAIIENTTFYAVFAKPKQSE